MRRKGALRSEVVKRMEKEGWLLTSRGWPDYFAVRPSDRKTCAVYVTTRKNLRKEQNEIALILTASGLPCYMTLDEMLFPIPQNRNSEK